MASLQENVPEYFTTLSLLLSDVLEDIGASKEITSLMTDEYSAGEKLESFLKSPKYSVHVFGSAYEGTQTRGMKSDVDSVYVDEELPVVTKIGKHDPEKCLLMIQDQSTPPGYVKLQLVQNGVPLTDANTAAAKNFITDSKYKICADGSERLVCTFSPSHQSFIGNIDRHGPALTQSRNSHIADKDILFAFRSQQVPDCVHEWFTRKRRYGWPPESDVQAFKTLGCLFVPIGHPDSIEKDKQWRLSLSNQERQLIKCLNLVQFQCFILLKLVKKEMIQIFLQKEMQQCLQKCPITSYHCKTSMLYMMENTPSDFWRPSNLLAAFVGCMKMISQWTQVGVCPNYFIPCENMFDRGVRGIVRDKLIGVMELLTSRACDYLLYIKSDEIGQRFRNALECHMRGSVRYRDNNVVSIRKLDIKYTHLNFALRTRTALQQDTNCESPKLQGERLQRIITRLNLMADAENTTDTLKKAVGLVTNYLEIGRMSSLVACSAERNEDTRLMLNQLTESTWQDISMRTDRFSSKLKQACHLSTLSHFQKSLEVLSEMNVHDCFSFCFCNQNKPIHPFGPNFQTPELDGISAEEHLHRYMVPCIIFGLGERDIIPTALQHEMVRSVDESCSNHDDAGIREKIARVDGIFLFHFMLYLNHFKLNMQTHAESDIENMEWVVNKLKISHKETALNLLGWAFHMQGVINSAADYFCRSLELKSHNNAASWHLNQIEIGTKAIGIQP